MRSSLLAIALLAVAAPAAADPPTKEQALATLHSWVEAQNDGDFAAYSALYAPRFVGIKRTRDGRSRQFTLSRWRSDRKRMFRGAQKVAAEGPNVVVRKGGLVTILFVQRYKSGPYADHGDKLLVLAASAKGLQIVREEMLYSAPGWEADPKLELDATALAPPVRVQVRQDAGDPKSVGGCASVSYTLVLTDAKGKKLTQDIGSGVINVEKATELMDADAGAAKLFEFGEWCVGGADYYEIVKNGDALVVRYQAADEGSPDEPPETPTWETRLTIRLPAGAIVK